MTIALEQLAALGRLLQRERPLLVGRDPAQPLLHSAQRRPVAVEAEGACRVARPRSSPSGARLVHM